MKPVLAAFLLVLALTPVAQAQSDRKAEQLERQLTRAYGGAALTNLRTVVRESEYSIKWLNQNKVPGVQDERIYVDRVAIDFRHDRYKRENWQEGFGLVSHLLYIVEGDGGATYNFPGVTKTDGTKRSAILNAAFAWEPTILVKALAFDTTKTEYLGIHRKNGVDYDVLKVMVADSPAVYRLYVNPQSGMIDIVMSYSQGADKPNWIAEISGYQTIDKIPFASSYHKQWTPGPFTVPIDLVSTREIRVNARLDDAEFAAPEGEFTPSQAPDDLIDTSQPSIKRIAKGIYHIGKEPAFSVFIDAGDYIIGAGGYAGLADRFEQFKKISGINKPYKYHLATHHHSDHIAGMPEAYDLGATIVAVDEHLPPIANVLGRPIPEGRLLGVEDRIRLDKGGDRAVEGYVIHMDHSDKFLMTYIPEIKAVFLADIYGANTVKSLPSAYNDNPGMLSAELDRLGLDVELLLDAHSRRFFTRDELRQMAALSKPPRCYRNRPICAGK